MKLFNRKKSGLHSKLGMRANDKITGFTGYVTAGACYVTGCDQYSVTAKSKSSSEAAVSLWFDVNRLTFDETDVISLDTSEDKGADVPCSPKG